MPIVIGTVFHLSIEEVSALMQRTFFIVGISSFLQARFGHRLPIADGPAGSWVGVFIVMADVAAHQGYSAKESLRLIEGGVVIAGALLLLLGLTGTVRKLLGLFTPLVTGSFLFILALQLSGVMMKGMLGMQGDNPQPDYGTAALALFVFLTIIVLSARGRGWLKQYAVLIGIAAGWLIYMLLGKQLHPFAASGSFVRFPELLAWGMQQWNGGVAITAVLFTLILVSNTIAAVTAVRQVAPGEERNPDRSLNRGIAVGGVSHWLSALFSGIAVVPLPVSAGFIRLTGQPRVQPFIWGTLALAAISLFPAIVGGAALLPVPIASGALLATFVQMLGIALHSVTKDPLNERRTTILAITLLVGVGLMFLPQAAFQGLPTILQYVFGNGLLVSTLLAIVLEQVWRNK